MKWAWLPTMAHKLNVPSVTVGLSALSGHCRLLSALSDDIVYMYHTPRHLKAMLAMSAPSDDILCRLSGSVGLCRALSATVRPGLNSWHQPRAIRHHPWDHPWTAIAAQVSHTQHRGLAHRDERNLVTCLVYGKQDIPHRDRGGAPITMD